jgi:hypothetical protein
MLAISSWTWIVAAALTLVSLGLLIRVALGLLGRLKDLNRSLQGASGKLNEELDQMRGDLERVNEGLTGLRQRREERDD